MNVSISCFSKYFKTALNLSVHYKRFLDYSYYVLPYNQDDNLNDIYFNSVYFKIICCNFIYQEYY